MYQAGCQRGWWLGKNLPYILFFAANGTVVQQSHSWYVKAGSLGC